MGYTFVSWFKRSGLAIYSIKQLWEDVKDVSRTDYPHKYL